MKHSLVIVKENNLRKIQETEYRPVVFAKNFTGMEKEFKDHGRKPYVVNIEDATIKHNKFRTALWTGEFIQMTLMSIPVGSEIGLEIHDDTDQFLRLEKGRALVQMGTRKENLDFEREITDDWVILVPSGYWHNITNIGNEPLKIYSIYGPPHHEHGTVERTK